MNAIKALLGFIESDIIRLIRTNLHRSSFRL
ncbi:MAG: DUF2805 domain-containing protein [Methyloprofundus sp.]|nr:DUF2805 domain-containing protein [Methyloprofundus sp.]